MAEWGSKSLLLLDEGFVTGSITLTGGSPVEAKVGDGRLSGREMLVIYNGTGGTVYWSHSVATANSSDGMPIVDGGWLVLGITDASALYVEGNGVIKVMEGH